MYPNLRLMLAACLLAAMVSAAAAATEQALHNPRIDMDGYLALAAEAAQHRARRRVGEEEFLRLSREPGSIVLDARSAEKFALLHVRGAINLSFPDIAVDTLAARLPDRNARILIYCNNNFVNAPAPFPTKAARASLNLSTYIALYGYGYRNLYELGPLIDPRSSRLPFESATGDTAVVVAGGLSR